MVHRQRQTALILLATLLGLTGCAFENTTKNNPVNTSESFVPPVPDIVNYEQIVRDAYKLPQKYRNLQISTGKFLDAQQQTGIKCMNVSIIAAAAYFWAGNSQKAKQYAVRAYQCAPEKRIYFLAEWDAQNWVENFAIAKKMAHTKDYILSCCNNGCVFFRQANELFINKAQFAKAEVLYSRALFSGIEDSQLRKVCTLHMAACLFKIGNERQAQAMFFHVWILDNEISLEFGDQATRDYFQSLRASFAQQFLIAGSR